MIAYQIYKLEMKGAGFKYEPEYQPMVLKNSGTLLIECIFREKRNAVEVKEIAEKHEEEAYPNPKHRSRFKIVKVEIERVKK